VKYCFGRIKNTSSFKIFDCEHHHHDDEDFDLTIMNSSICTKIFLMMMMMMTLMLSFLFTVMHGHLMSLWMKGSDLTHCEVIEFYFI